jgi:hypothetical protein
MNVIFLLIYNLLNTFFEKQNTKILNKNGFLI